jgi:hypothetical protein
MDINKPLSVLVIFTVFFAFLGLATAGQLTPSAPPAPTMKSLDDIHGAITNLDKKPIWGAYGKKFVDWPANPRFAIYDSETPTYIYDDWVLDKETGLVWLRSPKNVGYSTHTWSDAFDECYYINYYYRSGWRLPAIEELCSLWEYHKSGMQLPAGHPFDIEAGSYRIYWSSTASVGDPNYAWAMNFDTAYFKKLKSEAAQVWPVRGGNGCSGGN